MPSRVAEVIYKLKDLFSAPVKKVQDGYQRIRKSSRDTSDAVQRDNRRMAGSFNTVVGGLKTFAGAIGGVFAARSAAGAVGNLADELDRLAKTGRRLDLDPQFIAAAEFAFERSGVAASKVTAAIETLQKRTGEAVKGIGRAKIAFDSLGISVEDFIALNAEEQMGLLADRLQSVASEEERAAIAAQLFSKENGNVVQALEGGAAAFRKLIAEGKQYRQFTTEQAEAAERYNDALTNFSTKVDGIKFQALTPVIEELAEFFDNIGQGDKIAGLTAELTLLEQRLEKPFVFNRKGVERRIEGIRSQLTLLARETEKAANASDADAEALAKQRDEIQQTETALKGLVGEQTNRVKALKETLDQETAELRAARQEQLSIEREFEDLRNDVSAPDDQDVSLADVSIKQRQAAAALERGQAEEAIKLSREGAELLRKLKDDGDEAQLFLNFFAGELERTANAAAQSNVEKELLDAEKVKGEVSAAVGHMADLTETLKTEGGKAGQAYVDSMAEVIRGTTLPAPAIEPLRPVPDVVAAGIRNLQQDLERRVGK